jgi:hypothetical protein
MERMARGELGHPFGRQGAEKRPNAGLGLDEVEEAELSVEVPVRGRGFARRAVAKPLGSLAQRADLASRWHVVAVSHGPEPSPSQELEIAAVDVDALPA